LPASRIAASLCQSLSLSEHRLNLHPLTLESEIELLQPFLIDLFDLSDGVARPRRPKQLRCPLLAAHGINKQLDPAVRGPAGSLPGIELDAMVIPKIEARLHLSFRVVLIQESQEVPQSRASSGTRDRHRPNAT